MDKNKATDIMANKTLRGLVPANANMKEETTLAMLYFDKAAAKVKPPNKIMMVEDHICDKMYSDAEAASIAPLPWVDFKTLHATTNNGTDMEVTHKGKAQWPKTKQQLPKQPNNEPVLCRAW